jgi:hypothetical protein
MKIVYSDENGAVIPPVPLLPPEKEAPPVQHTTTWGILKSGWGIFLAVSGVVSVVLDMSIPGDFPLFRGSSFTLGWIFIIGILIVPAASTRYFGAAPINSALAVTWCIAGFVAWVVIHSIAAEVDPGKPVRPNLALLGGLILCWRLLTKPRQECPVSVTEEALVSDEGAQVSANAAVQAASSPAKISLKHERQIKASSQTIENSATYAHHGMSNRRKRVLVSGLFVICVAVTLYSLSQDDSPSLSWATILCGMWSAGVWLWQSWMLPSKAKLVTFARVIAYIAAALLGVCLLIFSAKIFFASITPKLPSRILEAEAAEVIRSIDSAPDSELPWMIDLLKRYKRQQDDLGEPEWPTQVRAEEDRKNRLRGFFEDLKTVDAAAPSLASVLPYSQNPDEDRARVANTVYLASRYGKTTDEISDMYELFRDDYARKYLKAPIGLDDIAFYKLVAEEIKTQRNILDLEPLPTEILGGTHENVKESPSEAPSKSSVLKSQYFDGFPSPPK